MALSRKERAFWRKEMAILDRQYKEKVKEWQRLIDLYELKFKTRIRDLAPKDLVRVSRFYPLVRQIISSTSFNYPKLFFAIEEEEGNDIAMALERASTAALEIMDVKPHVHQCIFDALTCGVAWGRIDWNSPGKDISSPYGTNSQEQEDFTSFTRVPPWDVHIDPQTPPNDLGKARYIREKLWVPLEVLKNDPNVERKNEIKPTTGVKDEDIGWGESYEYQTYSGDDEDAEEMRALRESIENGEMVRIDRIHDRKGRRLIVFAEGVQDEIMCIDHPFAKKSFPMALDPFGEPIMDDEGQPVFDLSQGMDIPGWLVHDGFALIPLKFDLSSKTFHPKPHLAYLEDLQELVVESVSRRANLLKRTSRQGLAAKRERMENPDLLDNLRKGDDGEWHEVLDVNNFKELQYGEVPSDQLRIEQDSLGYEQEIARTQEFTTGGDTPMTATQAGLVGAQASVNRKWMQSKVSQFYVDMIRSCFTIFSDPRYKPENFIINVARDGQSALPRVLNNSDFLWTYRLTVQAGSMEPLFEQIQGEKFMAFYDRAISSPNFDRVELDRMLAASVDMVDVEKVMISDLNPEAFRAAQLENEQMMSGKDPGVVQGQDHRAHIKTHGEIEQHPNIQELMARAQQRGFDGRPADPQAMQFIQQIFQIRDQHIASHEQAMQQEEASGVGMPTQASRAGMGMESTIRSNAQNVNNALEGETQQIRGEG